jgi:outer membrane usher protein
VILVTKGPPVAVAGLALWAAAAVAQVPAPASPPSERAIPFEVIVNGSKTGSWVLLERGGELYAPRDAFEEWRLQIGADAPKLTFKGQEYLALSAVPGFRAKVDRANQSVELLFSPQAFALLRMTREIAKAPVVSPVLPSVFLNYDLSHSSSSPSVGRTTRDLGGLAELGLSTQLGVLTTSALARNVDRDPDLGTPRRFVRLETTFTRDFPELNRTLRLGDTTTRRAMWGREVYYGGVRFGTNYALTPGFVSQPIPAVSGLSAAPSTVELYVNDVLRQVSNVPPGPFVIDNFPLLSGNGEARLVVRDLLGRETVIVQPFFTSAQMLARGLTDWSVEAGKVRRDLGFESGRYADGFASGTWRNGFSNELTIEARGEVSRKLRLVGAGMLSVLPWQMLAKAALVGSDESTLGMGGHWLLGIERQGTRGGFSVEIARSSRNFREVGQDLGALGPIKQQVAGNATYATEGFGTFGVGYASIMRFDATRIATVSGNYSIRVGDRSTLVMTASKVLSGGSGSAFGMTFLMPLDDNITTNATFNTRGGLKDHYLAAVHNPVKEPELGWRVLAGEQQNARRGEGGLYYLGQHGSLSADASYSPSLRALRFGATGGLVYADGHLFATRRFDESFAIAEVAGYPDVGIGIGGNVLARTNADGIALIPRLMPYFGNAVRIDPRELPINAELNSIEETVVPAWRSGVKVVFPVRSGRGALVKIVFDDNQPAPAGATVRIEGDKEEFYVARRGEAFVTGLKDSNRIQLRWNQQQCTFDVTLPAEGKDEISRIGPLACKGVSR